VEFESLIFDIDGTLWDSRSVVAKGYNAQLKEEGYERFYVDEAMLGRVFGKTTTEIADIVFEGLPTEISYPLMERCMKRENGILHEDISNMSYPDVRETLEQLAKKHRLFIVSNSECGYPELCIEKLEIGHLITGHMCYGDTGTCKGETIKKLMADHQITSACYIGDTQGDMESADIAGIPFVYCTYGFGVPDHYWKKVDSFAQLLEL